MRRGENEFRPRPGRSRDAGKGAARKATKLAVHVKRAASRAGYTRSRCYGGKVGGRTASNGRGRQAIARMRRHSSNRRVSVMARIVRHKGAHFRSAPLVRHISYLERDGVTRDGRDASMFDARGDEADRDAFAERCEDDRHHFRLIVSPEDAAELADLRTFTRELMSDMTKDLGTSIDWVAVDHWNTDNPHVHILVRGVADDGSDLVIDRAYVSEGIRHRAEERVTLELGPRSEQQIETALAREVNAERWTSLDQTLERRAQDNAGLIDLRPDGAGIAGQDRFLRGRVATLEALGLARQQSPGVWMMEADARQTLHDLGIRGDIIKTMHRAMAKDQHAFDPSALSLHSDVARDTIIGRLVERGLHDELAGTAYAIVDGVDGRLHYLRFDGLELTGDAKAGSIAELRSWEDSKGAQRQSLSVRSDLTIDAQVSAPGATWLDRQLVAVERLATDRGFGREVRDALDARAAILETRGLAHRTGSRWSFSSGLIEKLRSEELSEAARTIAERTGLPHRPSDAGESVTGHYRERITLSSGRFAMIDDGLGFQLVPWRPALDKQLGQQVTGSMSPTGSVAWTLGRSNGIGL